MTRFLFALLCMVVSGSRAGESWVLYHAQGADVSAIRQIAAKVAPPDTEVTLQALPNVCKSAEDLKVQHAALSAGVRTIPCLVLQDAQGCYATLPLRGLSQQGVREARNHAHAPQRTQLTAQRLLVADLYYDTARVHMPFISAQEKACAAEHLRLLTALENIPVNTRQFIALRCLYPALMCLYAAEYNKAHTAISEHFFMQAIAALELARDLDASSQLGRLAYEEREKLRAARLQAKKLD